MVVAPKLSGTPARVACAQRSRPRPILGRRVRTFVRRAALGCKTVEAAQPHLLEPDVTSARGWAGCGNVEGQLYVMGGNTLDSVSSSNDRYSAATDTWTSCTPMDEPA